MKDKIIKASILVIFTFITNTEVLAKKVLDIQHWTTNHGTKVYFVEVHNLPILDIMMAFDAGSARDNLTPGVASLANRLLNQGSQGLDATRIAENFENVGAQFDASSGRDKAVLHLRTLTSEAALKPALANFVAVMANPDFPQNAFERKKAEQGLRFQASLESATNVASNTLYETIYPDHAYSKPVLGTEESIPKLTLPQVKDFYHQYYVAKNATLAIVGAINLSQAKLLAEQLTAALPAGEKAKPIPIAQSLTTAVSKHISFPATQTVICLAQVGITYDNPDYFPLLVGNYNLGGGSLVSRLADEVREKRGLSYYIYSTFNPLPARGPFVIALATRTDQAHESLAVTKATLQQFLNQGPTAQELLAAKQYITGNFPLRFSSNASITEALISIGFYNLPLDYLDTYINNVEKVTREEIQAAFKRNINPQLLATITVGKDA